MHRFPRIIVLAVAAATLATGVAQAGKPVGATPAGQAWATTSGLNPIALNSGGAAAMIASLTLPSDGKFVINATVEVYNTDSVNEPQVNCQIRHGVAFGGTILDIAEVRLPQSNASGVGEAKLALTGVVERAGAPANQTVQLVCGSLVGAGANYGQLNAVSVSSLTIE